MTNSNQTAQRYVVLGGGYAGTMASLRLARLLPDAEVVLVDGRSALCERIRLHEWASGQASREHRYEELLAGSGVRFVQGWVRRILPDAPAVSFADGRQLEASRLVVALGSGAAPSAIPGVAEHGVVLGGAAGAERIRRRLPELEAEGGRIAVVGGGLTGIEAAAEIAEQRPGLRVVLIAGTTPPAELSPGAWAYVLARMEALGVRVIHERAARLDPGALWLDSGAAEPVDLALWCASFRVPEFMADAGLAVDGAGRMRVDAQLRSLSHPAVLGVGDAARLTGPTGVGLNMACGVAMPMGAHAASNLAREARGHALRPFSLRLFGYCVSLGRRDGVIQHRLADGHGRGWWFRGAAAAWVKERICRLSVDALTWEKRGFAYRWARNRRAERQWSREQRALAGPPRAALDATVGERMVL